MFQPDLLLAAAPAVQLHVATALTACVLAPVQLRRKRRDRLHKVLGYVWTSAMCITALSALFIHGIQMVGPFSPIHLFVVFTFHGLFVGIRAALRKDFKAHEAAMRNLTFGALGIAGLFAFLPGRLMNRVVFGESETLGFGVVLVFTLGAYAFGTAFVTWAQRHLARVWS